MNPLHNLLQEIANPATLPARRADLGLALSILGDPRAGVGVGKEGIPDIVWCRVEQAGTELTSEVSTPAPFYVAMYPVTHAQFKAFIDAPDGYAADNWWAGLNFGKQTWQNTAEALNAPADNVAWVNAVAFCRWLNSKVASTPSLTATLPGLRPDYQLRLPTETEWLQAATGNHPDYVYPWGTDWKPDCANSKETELRKAVSVGLFPDGAAPCGALDMVGNTWEWCLTTSETAPHLNVTGVERRIMCGGSYLDGSSGVRCDARLSQHPLSRNNTSSFRVVYASAMG